MKSKGSGLAKTFLGFYEYILRFFTKCPAVTPKICLKIFRDSRVKGQKSVKKIIWTIIRSIE